MPKGTVKNAKISDYFKKITPNHAEAETDHKRKLSNLTESPESKVLGVVTNLPQKCSPKLSPFSKKPKHNDSSQTDLSDGEQVQNNYCHNSFKIRGESSSNVTLESPIFKSPKAIRTPAKNSPAKQSLTPKRGTPKKLFEKSPKKLEEFNVKILEDFINISPTFPNTLNRTPQKINLSAKFANSPSSSEKRCIKSEIGFLEDCIKTEFLISENNCNVEDQKNIKMENTSLDNMLMNEFSEVMEKIGNLTFNEPQYCKILEVEKINDKVLLKVESCTNKEIGVCSIEDFWSSFNFKVDDKVYISAVKNSSGVWVINNNDGLLVYEPDLLISCTSVVGSLFCKRRSVLSERFRGFESDNRVMIIGVLIHNLLQTALKNRLKTTTQVENLAKKMLKSRDIIKRLYDNDLRLEDVESEILTFVPKVVDFIQQYIKGGSKNNQPTNNWSGHIYEINDIEENLWCPELGIKGKIDVTVKTMSGVMPLELKTGRASVSLEHKGQVMLYIMMMNKYGYKVSSGLLLYLREGVVKEIKATPREKRDIMILRNELAYFLSRKVTKGQDDKFKLPELPEPIDHFSCSKCPYNTICTSFLRAENYDLSNHKHLKKIQDDVGSYLSEAHLNYFIHWSTLLSLDDEPNSGFKTLREIYTVTPEKREKQGRCIIGLKIMEVGAECNGLCKHTFEKKSADSKPPLISYGILENNYVVISTDKRPAVATGFVTEVSTNFISVALDRNLQIKYKDENFYLDTYDSNITQTFNLTSLALLLENTPRAAQLRSIIIDRQTPTFCQKLPALVAKRGVPILKRLNQVQQKAVLKALCAKEFLLIKGMPGTGKTATIIALIQLLVELNKTVLITSHTHSAIDNICSRLITYGVDFIRLGSESRIDQNLKSKCEASLTKDCHTPEDFERVYNSFKVIAVTCLGSGHPLLSKRTVDVCLVDESTQAIQTSVIKPLYAAKTFVLIGDPEQLAPVVRNRDAVNSGMTESLFERLNTHSEGIVTLDINYRMNATITRLVNELTYEGQLKTANDNVANNSLKIPNQQVLKSAYHNHKWLLKALDTSLEAAVQFIDTGPVWQQSQNLDQVLRNLDFGDNTENNCLNIYEAGIVATLVNALIKGGVSNSNIGVIATYRAQVSQISTLLSGTGVDISTVDQFQGRDKNVIIYSCAKSKDMAKTASDVQKFELLEDKRRLTVAISRAKQKLLIVGDLSTLKSYSTFSVILKSLQKNIVHFDSDWDSILNNFH